MTIFTDKSEHVYILQKSGKKKLDGGERLDK
jgi:hypothetical protein